MGENRAKNIFRTEHILSNSNSHIGSFDFNYLWIGVLISVTYELVLVFRELKKTINLSKNNIDHECVNLLNFEYKSVVRGIIFF